MPTDAPYSISDLARLTGLSVRTIRYYLAQGLIPASGESGPGAHYGEGHLGRLRLVRRLQQQHLPLAEIRERLGSLTDEQVEALAEAAAPAAPPVPETTALDYVRAVLAGSHRSVPRPESAPPAPATPAAPLAAMPAMRDVPPAAGAVRRMAMPSLFKGPPTVPTDAHHLVAEASAPAVEPATGGQTPPTIERSQWERLSLGPNLELHVRRPLGRLEQKRVERLITIARQVLKEEQP